MKLIVKFNNLIETIKPTFRHLCYLIHSLQLQCLNSKNY